MVLFKITDKFGRKITLTKERFWHIMKRPEAGDLDYIKEILLNPDEVRESVYDEKVWLYYKMNPKRSKTEKYILVGVKLLNSKGFILTSFLTNRIKEGKLIWKRD